jgi:catechol 2,3-dioxygenase-like lactoylglutathione lyase family enzyme
VRSALAAAALVAAAAGASGAQAPAQLRFHHLHVRVEDPAAAMTQAVSRVDGTRVILQGLGVGVRIGDQYVLFDRGEDAAPGAGPQTVDARYAAAVRWLKARNLHAAPIELGATEVAAIAGLGRADHIAFATPDLAAVVAALRRSSAAPLKQTDESAVFAIDDGTMLEIARDTDRPDAFWCPMHPDVRSASPASCPLCSMALVPIPPPTLGHYRLDVTQVPKRSRKGTERLRVAVRHPQSSALVTTFTEIHERLFHLFIVGRDLSHFEHVHPEKGREGFEIAVDLAPGAYVLIADFVPSDGTPQLVQHAIVTPGYRGSAFAPADLRMDIADKTVGGVRVSLAGYAEAGKDSVLRFTLRDVTTGAPVGDLEPYLGASGHLLAVNADLTHAIHGHPEEREQRDARTAAGGEILFAPVLPQPGVYKLWVQFQRKGTVFTVPFAIAAQ